MPGVKFVNSGLFFRKEERNYANTDGSVITQIVIQSWPLMQITAVAPDFSDFQNRGNVVAPAGRGYEYVARARSRRQRGQVGRGGGAEAQGEAGRGRPLRSRAASVASLAHDSRVDRASDGARSRDGLRGELRRHELRRAAGEVPRQVQVRSGVHEHSGRSHAGRRLATIGYDDDGVKPDDFLIIKNGIVNDYQTTREQASWLKWWYDQQKQPTRSHGCSYADSWSSVQFQRMPNVSLLPGEKDLKWEDLIAATDRGIAIIGDGSFSIDQQRYNAQFGGQVFYEIKGGKITGMLKDVAYQMRTPDFWNAMDMIGGKSSYQMGGASSTERDSRGR